MSVKRSLPSRCQHCAAVSGPSLTTNFPCSHLSDLHPLSCIGPIRFRFLCYILLVIPSSTPAVPACSVYVASIPLLLRDSHSLPFSIALSIPFLRVLHTYAAVFFADEGPGASASNNRVTLLLRQAIISEERELPSMLHWLSRDLTLQCTTCWR